MKFDEISILPNMNKNTVKSIRKIDENDVKTSVKPHTQAKLELFKGYLEHYLRILCNADFCKKINLFDIYCGAGIYNDGKKGSPLLAIDCIKNIRKEMLNSKKSITPISLLVNDYKSEKIENVRSNANTQGINNFSIEYCNKNANEMFDIVAAQLSNCPKDHRNLIFIDPYGYSDINKDKITNLLKNKYTEIVLFLPISQMYRFIETAFRNEDKPQNEPLLNFIKPFFENFNNIKFETQLEFIHYIKEALSINNSYFTCSHYIEREKGIYYALFFITSNIYGLEKMLETKWKLDPVKGEGFKQNKNPMQFTMFGEELNKIDYLREISYLEEIICQLIKQKNIITNVDLYELTLRNEFLPKHANLALKNLIAKNKIREISKSDGYNIECSCYKNKRIVSTFGAL